MNFLDSISEFVGMVTAFMYLILISLSWPVSIAPSAVDAFIYKSYCFFVRFSEIVQINCTSINSNNIWDSPAYETTSIIAVIITIAIIIIYMTGIGLFLKDRSCKKIDFNKKTIKKVIFIYVFVALINSLSLVYRDENRLVWSLIDLSVILLALFIGLYHILRYLYQR